MSESSSERGNFSKWLWAAALTPMCLCGVVMAVLFGTNLVTLRQTTQQQSLRNTQARLTSRAISLTSAVRFKATEQARVQTSTAIMQAMSDGSRYPLILSDAFDVNSRNWLNGIHTSGKNNATLAVSEGKYQWHLTAGAKGFMHIVTSDAPSAQKFYLSVEVKQLSGPFTADYGVVFRKNENDFYYFNIDGNQYYRVNLWQDNKWKPLVATRRNYAIRLNDVNRLAVVGDGVNYFFYINGQFVDRMSAVELSDGAFGLAAQLASAGDDMMLEFDDFELRAPPDTGLPTSTPNPPNTLAPTSTRTRTPTRAP
ncbi:MAG: hypothetical protein HZC38_03995 [Chloroflexi bacterium]|nr:hypothetical protein [Chloroflexota bacterium]